MLIVIDRIMIIDYMGESVKFGIININSLHLTHPLGETIYFLVDD